MQILNFEKYSFRFEKKNEKLYIFDIIRKKMVVLTPEEWVRQHTIHFLINEKKIPQSLINIEKELTIAGLKKRYDIIVFQPSGAIFLAVECKAPSVAITQATFDQIARYNLALNAQYSMITNGLQHFFFFTDFTQKKYVFLPDLPLYVIDNQ